MSLPDYAIKPQRSEQHTDIELLLDQAFGISRRTKTTYRLREGEQPIEGLSFVAQTVPGRILGAISFWALHIGAEGFEALLLGPLAVDPDHQGQGVGRALMRHGLQEARSKGHRLVMLVGDEPYYGRIGFQKVPDGQLLIPGPVDPDRLLYLELADGALSSAHGLVLSPRRYTPIRAAEPAGANPA